MSNPLRISRRLFCLVLAALAACALHASVPTGATEFPRPVESVLEAQVELHRRGFSCGSIDGVHGGQTAAALRAFQRFCGLGETGDLDPPTKEKLQLSAPALTQHTFAEDELMSLRPLPPTWLEKSQQPALPYATALELAAERYRANRKLLRQLNPGLNDEDWLTLLPGTSITVPAVEVAAVPKRAAQVVIRLGARELQVFDDSGLVLAHFPVSIARKAEKRPVGELRITTAIRDPNFTFDPAVFTESEEGKQLGRRLIIPPGPNNPVGRVWIGLDRSGYGIHGTPDPEKVGRTESHGCFRLANWDALTLLGLVRVGMAVRVEE